MVVKPEQQQMQMLLTEAITVLCKNGLQYRSHFNVEGLLGITLDDEDVFLVSIKQTVKGAEAGDSSINVHLDKQGSVKKQQPLVETSPMSRAKQRKRRKRSTDSIERVITSTNIPLNNNNPEKRNSNVPYDYKQQEDNFDDSASSPGELIVVKEENLTDIERAHYGHKELTEKEQHAQYSHKELTGMERAHYSHKDKDKSPHSRNTAITTTNTQQQESDSKDGPSNGAIYASSNGQIGVDAQRNSPYNGQIEGHRTSPYQQAWDSPYATTSDAQNDSGTEDRSFAQQVCSTLVLHF